MFYLTGTLFSWFLGTQSAITLTDMGVFSLALLLSMVPYRANKWLGTSRGHAGFLPRISMEWFSVSKHWHLAAWHRTGYRREFSSISSASFPEPPSVYKPLSFKREAPHYHTVLAGVFACPKPKVFEAFSFNFVFSASDAIVHSAFHELTVSNYRFMHMSLSLPY